MDREKEKNMYQCTLCSFILENPKRIIVQIFIVKAYFANISLTKSKLSLRAYKDEAVYDSFKTHCLL